jgi:protease I
MRRQKRTDRLLSTLAVLVVVCTACALGGCKRKGGDEMEMGELPDITGKKVVMIIARNNFRDEELFEPKEIIEKAGGSVTVASSSLNAATGMLRGTVKPQVLLKDVSADDFDAVVFVGGSGASEYWNDGTAHALAKAAAQKDKFVCAICIAPVTLANAGLLDGKKATVWKSEIKAIKKKGAKYTGAEVVTDGNLITADGPTSAAGFGTAIVRALGK